MKGKIKRVLTGKGICNELPEDLVIGQTYELRRDFELRGFVVLEKYKALSFNWNKPLS